MLLMLMLTLTAQTARAQVAQTGTVTITPTTGAVLLGDGAVLTGTGGVNTNVSIDAGATVTLSGVDITDVDQRNDDAYAWAGLTCLGDAVIVLADGTTNKVKGGWYTYPGILIPQNHTLTIKGSGSLEAYSGTRFNDIEHYAMACGIGGRYQYPCGNIVIESGNILAVGKGDADGGPGIGCYNETNGASGNITITGGTVTAIGGKKAAGIGSGDISRCGDITITGGTVTAIGGSYAAGIGGGRGLTSAKDGCGTITIGNGVTSVTATAGYGCDNAIGAGYLRNDVTVNYGNFLKMETENSTVTIESGVRYLDATGTVHQLNIGEFTELTPGCTLNPENATTATEQWLVVGGNTEFTSGLDLYGTTHLILLDDATLTVSSGGNKAFYTQGVVNIYGSVKGNGRLDITNGGSFYAAGLLNIYGGDIRINGSFKGPGTKNLSWTCEANRFTAANYSGSAPRIVEGKAFTDADENFYKGTLDATQTATLGGITLIPITYRPLRLSDNDNNTPAITTAAGFSAEGDEYAVTLLGRTLYCDGGWNTLCLPFDLNDFSGTPLEGFTVKELDTETAYDGHVTGLDGTTLYLNFRDATKIEAGKPYIVKKLAMDDLSNPTYTATAGTSGAPSYFGFDKLLDGNLGSQSIWYVPIKSSPAYCEFHADMPVYVTDYTLTTTSENVTNDPTAWTLSGSADGSTQWTVIDSRNSNENASDALPSERSTGKDYTAQHPGTYKYFRLDVTTSSGGLFMSLAELTMHGKALLNDVEPTFNGVTVSNATPISVSSTDGSVSFVGTYKSTTFDSEDKSILLMGAENTLYYPTTGARIGAQRAYFKIGDGAQLARDITAFHIGFGENDEATGVTTPLAPWRGEGGAAWYTIDGRKLDGKPTQRGIYINNGNKIVIK